MVPRESQRKNSTIYLLFGLTTSRKVTSGHMCVSRASQSWYVTALISVSIQGPVRHESVILTIQLYCLASLEECCQLSAFLSFSSIISVSLSKVFHIRTLHRCSSVITVILAWTTWNNTSPVITKTTKRHILTWTQRRAQLWTRALTCDQRQPVNKSQGRLKWKLRENLYVFLVWLPPQREVKWLLNAG